MTLSGIADFIRSKKITCSAVIVAAGSSQRFGGDKLMACLMGTPVIAYSISAFQYCDYIKEIILVTSPERLTEMEQLCAGNSFSKVTKIVIGGATRVESALSGISECDPETKLIAVHDGARPLVTADVINRAVELAFSHKAAAPAVPARDTVKVAPNMTVSETPDREAVYLIQTPQVFSPVIIKGALTNALTKGLKVFDDASAVEALGFPVYLSEGSEENIKITSPLDIKFAETILKQRRDRFISEREGDAQ